ncbi:MAG TPA: DUF3592 domain-containing protein [Gemmataceae bacterium]|nr:DUF3592 domain-containing protein [Gemmataceae bacterium]
MNVPESKLRWRYYGGGAAIVAIVAGLFLGTIFVLVGYFVRQNEEEYAKNGIASNATVTGKDQRMEPPTGQKGGPRVTYTLHYRYQDAQGQTHDGGDSVDANFWNQYQKGQAVQIEYLRDRPERSRITVGRSFFQKWGYILALAAGCVLLAGVLVLGVGGWFWAGRKMQLVRDGEPSRGVVTDLEAKSSGAQNRQTSYRLRFQFIDSTGVERYGKSVWLPRALESRWQAGDSILVLQDPNNPERFEADIFEARADELKELPE